MSPRVARLATRYRRLLRAKRAHDAFVGAVACVADWLAYQHDQFVAGFASRFDEHIDNLTIDEREALEHVMREDQARAAKAQEKLAGKLAARLERDVIDNARGIAPRGKN
jgi:hypothetical protein